jgi:hypothetical protein
VAAGLLEREEFAARDSHLGRQIDSDTHAPGIAYERPKLLTGSTTEVQHPGDLETRDSLPRRGLAFRAGVE